MLITLYLKQAGKLSAPKMPDPVPNMISFLLQPEIMPRHLKTQFGKIQEERRPERSAKVWYVLNSWADSGLILTIAS